MFRRLVHRVMAVAAAVLSALSMAAQNRFVSSIVANDDAVATSWGISGMFFFVNDEYFAPQVEGYTLVGMKIRPTLEYAFTDSFSLVGGLEWLQYGGLDKVRHVTPFFAAKWQMNDAWLLRMGALPGPAAHYLPDEISNVEEQITERPEIGARLTARAKWCNFDAWVSWRQFIFRDDSIPEKFTAGFRASSVVRGAGASFTWRAALVFDHIGGQISNYSEPMQSLASLELRPGLLFLNEEGTIERFSLTVSALGHRAMAGRDVRPFSEGWAVHPKAEVNFRLFEVGLGYFYGRNFYSPNGNPLYWSVSNYDATVYEKSRSIVDMSAWLNKHVNEMVRFSIGGRGFYDTRASRFDYAYEFHLAMNFARD